VLECVAALDQLHATLSHELERRTRMTQELAQAHVTLADARLQLAGTRAEERQARYMALHDSLTTLPNRAHFRARLDAALAPPAPERRRVALLYIDLDGFKPINDAHGHDVGDELLRIVAARLSRAVRIEDLVGRLGGDEFACLLSNLPSRDQMSHLACKLFDAVSAPLTIGALNLTIRPSIGIATCPEHGVTPELLLKHADAAMYQAKRERTGYAFFDPAAV
jgi:diguanylate cyclase (GGDEF)-like protein